METAKPTTVEQYFAALPETTRSLMETLRATIQQAAPKATEMLSYGMPAFKQHDVLVYYAAWKEHIALYPLPLALLESSPELARYKSSKGTAKFPLNQPLPLDLIAQIVQFRLLEDEAKAELKKLKKK